jgi:hypothetical protein
MRNAAKSGEEKMCRRRLLIGLAALAIANMLATTTLAQRRVPLYRSDPPGRTFSFLMRGNRSGAVADYFTFIQPRREFDQIVRTQNLRVGQIERSIQLQQYRLNQLQAEPSQQPQMTMGQQQPAAGVASRPSTVGTPNPSRPASFFNFSHFYRSPQASPTP